MGAVIVLAVLGGAAALIVPEIDEGKDERAAEEQRKDAAFEAAKQRELAEEGRPRQGRAERPPEDLSPPAERRARRRARRRGRAGDNARCAGARARRQARRADPRDRVRDQPAVAAGPLERDLSVRRMVYDCLAIKSRDPGGQFVVGHSFEARVDYTSFRYAWAKICLPPGEGSARLTC